MNILSYLNNLKNAVLLSNNRSQSEYSRFMMSLGIIFIVANLIFCTSCVSTTPKEKTIREIKSALTCIEFKTDVTQDNPDWTEVEKVLGEADEYPTNYDGEHNKNTRVYHSKYVIFHVESKKIEKEGKARFHEVVTKIEICKNK